MMIRKNGFKKKDLIKYLERFADDNSEIWIETGEMLSSPVTRICRLNQNDILLESNAFDEPS